MQMIRGSPEVSTSQPVLGNYSHMKVNLGDFGANCAMNT